MNKSESIKNLAMALGQFNDHVGKVRKDATNPFFNKKYASLPNILEAIAEPLKLSGIVFAQFPTDNNGLSTIIIHTESGEWMESTYIMPVAKQNDPQAVGSAITYARRYALSSAFGLNVDDDDDANAASVAKPTPPAAKATLDQVLKQIAAAKALPELTAIFNANKHLNTIEPFMSALSKRKAELTKP